MSPPTFSEYALSPDLTPDATYTIELLIEWFRAKFDPVYWKGETERRMARESRHYKPSFSKKYVHAAEKVLKTLSWLSLQRVNDRERPIRDLNALRYLPKLTGLSLDNNRVRDISPIANCRKLKRLHLSENPIRDVSALASCKELELLGLESTPVENLQVLEQLPKLRDLSVSAAQVRGLKQLTRLPAIVELSFGRGSFDSFKRLPAMPNVRILRCAHVKRLEGLEKFPTLENLMNLSGTFDTLAPLSNLKSLTHIDISKSRVNSLEPLSKLTALRHLCLATTVRRLDLSPLRSLPFLHDLDVECGGKKPASQRSFNAKLESWDTEFRADEPRHTPSLEVEIVDQKTFDLPDGKQPFNRTPSETNEGLLESEREWLDDQINNVLAVDFEAETDYTLPSMWSGARSRTVVLFSETAIAAFPRLVLGIQGVLSNTTRDWIIYLQPEDGKFAVWIYPDRIITKKKHAKIVRRLIQPS